MPTAEEALGSGKTELAGDLAAGVSAISSNQTIHFAKYVRLVLPFDGYVFWVKANIVSKSALLNASPPGAFAPDAVPAIKEPAIAFDAQGSLHYATDNKRQADSAYAVNRVVFTSLGPVVSLNDVGPNVMWVGEFDGLKFSFSSRKSYYQQAGLHHYVGDAVYPVMQTQLIDDVSQLSVKKLIASNSLPIWLSMNGWDQQPWEFFGNSLTLFPAYLVKDNLVPPYGAVEVTSTSVIAASPRLGRTLTHDQQVRDRVRVTLWGLNNDDAMNFIDFVEQFSLNTNSFGLANAPVTSDSYRLVQVEIDAIAQKKVIDYEINYHQRSARDIARQLILRAVPTFNLN